MNTRKQNYIAKGTLKKASFLWVVVLIASCGGSKNNDSSKGRGANIPKIETPKLILETKFKDEDARMRSALESKEAKEVLKKIHDDMQNLNLRGGISLKPSLDPIYPLKQQVQLEIQRLGITCTEKSHSLTQHSPEELQKRLAEFVEGHRQNYKAYEEKENVKLDETVKTRIFANWGMLYKLILEAGSGKSIPQYTT